MNYRESPKALKGKCYLTILADKFFIWFVVTGFVDLMALRHFNIFYDLFYFILFPYMVHLK